MATPHIAGLGAYLLAAESISADQLCARIVELSIKGVLTSVPSGTVNAVAFNGVTA